MKLTKSEELTLNFYEWELKGRGYYLSPSFLVNQEPPFQQFTHKTFNLEQNHDDGKVPSYFQRFKNILLSPSNQNLNKEPKKDFFPLEFKGATELKTIRLKLSKKKQVSLSTSFEFIELLSNTSDRISFEIIGDYNSIHLQLAYSIKDSFRIESLLNQYFNDIPFEEIRLDEAMPFQRDENIAICDFGLEYEFMRPINTILNDSIDSLSSIYAVLNSLKENDVVCFQLIFKGVSNSWASSIVSSVTDGKGDAFFIDAPEILEQAKNKIEHSLFSNIMRIAVQSGSRERISLISNELIRNIKHTSNSKNNSLIPLSNEGYSFESHLWNLFNRTTNRLGFIINAKELLQFIHIPNTTIVSDKLWGQYQKSKLLPSKFIKGDIYIGENIHENISTPVYLQDSILDKHGLIVGGSGFGKSTTLININLERIKRGLGVAFIDPHGEAINKILERIPDERKEDVILIDPSDLIAPIGFNFLKAYSEVEKIVLSSDLVSIFKENSTSWGDVMTSVLSNVITVFTESKTEGTLMELKKFLVDDDFRNDFLKKNINDAILLYFWEKDYPLLKKRITPLITRIDTFLRPKPIQYMLFQKGGIDFDWAINNNKIILIKLSQGLLGQENSYLLGSLILSKISQVVFSRENLNKEQLKLFTVTVDEAHKFLIPSLINNLISGGRKYKLGLFLCTQNLKRLNNSEVLDTILSNTNIKIIHKTSSEYDAKLFANNSFFGEEDLSNLDIGETVLRVSGSKNDFNVKIPNLENHHSDNIKNYIVKNSRAKYGTPIEIIKKAIDSLFNLKKETKEKTLTDKKDVAPTSNSHQIEPKQKKVKLKQTDFEKKAIALIEQEEQSKANREHTFIQTKIKKLGQQLGFLSIEEKETNDGGKIDVYLEKDEKKIGIEISVKNSVDYEIKNISKCINYGCNPVVMVSKNQSHLSKIEVKAKQEFSINMFSKIIFCKPEDVIDILIKYQVSQKPNVEVVKGFTVKTSYEAQGFNNTKNLRQDIARLLFRKKK